MQKQHPLNKTPLFIFYNGAGKYARDVGFKNLSRKNVFAVFILFWVQFLLLCKNKARIQVVYVEEKLLLSGTGERYQPLVCA